MRRVTGDELVFYDRVAQRIANLLGSQQCALTQSRLAARIGWNRASLCNFVNRIDKSIAAHFIPRIASVLHVSVEHLMLGEATPVSERCAWDPRLDDAEIILEKLTELRRRNAHCLCLTGILPTEALSNQAMVANFVDSMVGGSSPTVAERWHELIEWQQNCMTGEGAQDVDYVISMSDLLKFPRRKPPYQTFTYDEIVHLLENLKREWVRNRGLRIVAIDDDLVTPEMELELASTISLSVLGCETRFRCRKDLRIDWDDNPDGVRFSRECLIRLKRSAGYGVRERPSAQQVERLIDELLISVKADANCNRIPRSAESAPRLDRRGKLELIA